MTNGLGKIFRVGLVAAAMMLAALPRGNAAHAEDTLTPQAQAAKAVAESYMFSDITWKGPTSSPKPIAGTRVAVVSCCQAAEGAARAARAMLGVADKIGWKMDVFDGRGDPQEQNKAVNAAVDANYDAIILLFVDTPVVTEGVTRALDAGIKVITLGSLKNTPDSIPDVSWNYAATGEAVANYMIWKSNGAVNALLLLNTDLYVVREGQYRGTEQVLKDLAKCPGCEVQTREWSLANLDSQPVAIASAALQSEPTTNWVWCFDACMSRVARGMAAAGLSQGVSGAGFDCNAENLQLIEAGIVQAVCAGDSRDWVALATIDNLNRMLHGEPTVDQGLPVRMFDATNIAQLSDEERKSGWQGGYDFRDKYLELWGAK